MASSRGGSVCRRHMMTTRYGLVLAADQARQRVLALPCDFRAGLETGEVVSNLTGSRSASGPAISVAARLQQGAQPGEVLIGPQAMKVVRGAAVVEQAPEPPAPPHGVWSALIPGLGSSPVTCTRKWWAASRTHAPEDVVRPHGAAGNAASDDGARRCRHRQVTPFPRFSDSLGGRARTITAACVDAGSGRTFGLLYDLLVQAGGGSDWSRLSTYWTRTSPGWVAAWPVCSDWTT